MAGHGRVAAATTGDVTSFPTVPDLVARVARANGGAGERWLRQLPEQVEHLLRRWDLRPGAVYPGGTAGLVLAVVGGDGTPAVLKLALPRTVDDPDTFARAVRVHQLADGRGCARLLAHDDETRALLLERLGPNLADLGLPLAATLDAIASTLRTFWRPVDEGAGLPTGADKAMWLRAYILETWTALGRPFERTVLDRALALCDERAAAFDERRAVLVHGDAHGWNTVAAGDGTYRFVDPEGLRSAPEHDLAVPMREYNEPLLQGDTGRLVRERAERLAAACDVDAEAVWQWGFVERVSTGLANLAEIGASEAAAFFEVARRSR